MQDGSRLFDVDFLAKTKIKKRDPAYDHLQYDQNLATVDEIQEKITADDDVFIEYFIGQEQAYLFLITKEKVQWFPIDNDDQLKITLDKFQQLLTLLRNKQ